MLQRRLRHAFGVGRPTGLLRPPLAIVVLALVGSCTPRPPGGDLFHSSAELRVVTLNAPTSYYRAPRARKGWNSSLRASSQSVVGPR